jgi:RNase P subunit RPR2
MSSATRYRCSACGNLTRFDVEARRHTKRFLHFSIAGEPSVEEEEVVAEEIVAVTCRWCGRADAIEEVPRVATE